MSAKPETIDRQDKRSKTVLLLVSVEEDSLLDRFPAYGTFLHSIPTHLTGSMTTQENHILQSIQTNGTHGLLLLFKGRKKIREKTRGEKNKKRLVFGGSRLIWEKERHEKGGKKKEEEGQLMYLLTCSLMS